MEDKKRGRAAASDFKTAQDLQRTSGEVDGMPTGVLNKTILTSNFERIQDPRHDDAHDL